MNEQLLATIAQAGFKGVPVAVDRKIHIQISGMTCESCASGLAARLNKAPGVKQAAVDYKTKQAFIILSENASIQPALETIRGQGFIANIEKSTSP